jgi:hypothetical protein
MNAPKLPSFFKSPSHKQFQMATRYYDEKKERVQRARMKAERKEEQIEKGRFTSTWKEKSNLKSSSSSWRVLFVVFVLCLFTYWILKF